MAIGKLLISMSLPAMLSMLVQALYNIVDSIFIGQYDAVFALTAVNIAMPFQNIPLAFALGIGVGTNAIVSKSLGEGNREKASLCAQTGFVLALLVYAVFIFVGLFLSPVYAAGFSENNAQVEELMIQYLTIVVSLSGFMFMETLLTKVLQATGNMIVPMIAQLIGAISNIILDPLFINGFWIIPEMGIQGAAIATVLGQGLAMCFTISVYIIKKQDVDLKFKQFRMRLENIKSILVVGIPTAVLNGLASFTTIVLYAILSNLTAKTILGLYFKVQSFAFMPVFGLNQGALPIMSYNYGRGERKRFWQTYKLAIGIAFGILAACMVVFLAVPDFLLAIFNISDVETLDMGRVAFRMICCSFIPAAFGIITITMLQSTQNGGLAMIIAICRQLLFLLPIAYAIKMLTGDAYLTYIWLCYPIAEVLALCISLPFGLRKAKKTFDKREEEMKKMATTEVAV